MNSIRFLLKKALRMSSNELQFKNNNPGAVQYGNFINYYEFNPPSNRITLLPSHIWSATPNTTEDTFLALDIGCNAGNLTHELMCFLQKQLPQSTKLQILAVDIDPVLIERARENYTTSNIQFETSDCTQSDFTLLIDNFLKNNKKTKFDAIFCFSTTMWIHLNHGDKGLQEFLKNMTALCEMFVVEPQPWKCYTSAVKRMKGNIEFQHFKTLKMRVNVVKDIELFFTNELNMIKVFESTKTEWKRIIFCFKHTSDQIN